MEGNKGTRPGTHTKDALRQKAAAKKEHQVQLGKAVALVATGAVGPDAAASKVEGCTARQLRYAIEKGSATQPCRPAWAILTVVEMKRLVEWVLACEANDNPAKEREVSDQVQKMLQVRRLANRSKQNGKTTTIVELTPAEERIAIEGGALSHKWFQGFYANNPEIEMKTAHKQESKRVNKQREDVVERHFNGEFGLTESLQRRGIMDSDGKILDKRRLLNGDEMPAFLDFVTHSTKALGKAGKALQQAGAENRECATVNMVGDLSGFIYGAQYLVARKQYQSSYGDCTEPWAELEDYGELCHDDKIYILEQRSTYSLVSLTDKGVQTGESFANSLRFLRLQIDARNVALVRLNIPVAPARSACARTRCDPPAVVRTARRRPDSNRISCRVPRRQPRFALRRGGAQDHGSR
jgi:hypothetical protein